MAVTDNFNRADNADLGANWTPVTGEGSAQIVSNAVETGAIGTDSVERYSGSAFANDQYGQVVVKASGASQGVGPIVRAASGARTYYFVYILGVGAGIGVQLSRRVAGTGTPIDSTTTTIAVNDVIKLEVSGNSLTVKNNGTTIIGPTTDANIGSGSAGLIVFADSGALTDAVLDDWEGGDLGAAAAQVPYQPNYQMAPILAQ